MFWIIVAVVLVVGFAVAWWTSGRARPSSDGSGPLRHRVEGEVENYRSEGNAPTRQFRL
ncbi:hypothetical protein [Nocardioides deserti]|uniref:Secreted protein n=1 Tax=Nocardioides deserti TaxID=1588644 RepID=A0ABR6U616_9ACTN|nr:hypothetical protein [Nocardioides deserti]MBC2959558.1 hypothetical protein [Nocardioides deserti]GGO73894.1 hypothetical protein GCM10012276_20600 [Nocardioides deserti]